MKIRQGSITDRLKIAEQIEVRDTDSSFFGDLTQLFTPEMIEQGFSINFGGDRSTFSEVVDTFGLQKAIDAGSASIIQATTFSGGNTHYAGKAIEALGRIELVEALDVLQLDEYCGRKESSVGFPYDWMQTWQAEIESSLLIVDSNGTAEEAPKLLPDVGIVLVAHHRHNPDLSDGENFEGLADVLIRIEEKPFESKVGALATYLFKEGLGIYLPDANYILKVGKPICRTPNSDDIIGITGNYYERYLCKLGKIMKKDQDNYE